MNPTAQLSVYKYLAVVQICTKAPRGNEAKLLLMEPIVTTEGKDCYSFPNNRMMSPLGAASVNIVQRYWWQWATNRIAMTLSSV